VGHIPWIEVLEVYLVDLGPLLPLQLRLEDREPEEILWIIRRNQSIMVLTMSRLQIVTSIIEMKARSVETTKM